MASRCELFAAMLDMIAGNDNGRKPRESENSEGWATASSALGGGRGCGGIKRAGPAYVGTRA